MGFGSLVLGMLVISLYGFAFLGLPVVWAAWRRNRQAAIISRQIALTDALDAAVGPVVSPVVEKPWRGPWRIRIAVPLMSAESMGRIFATAQAVLSSAEYGLAPYQLVLTPLRGRFLEPNTPRASSRPGMQRPEAFAA
jgi:hypothetical protein